jgi:hypothetical protein
MAVGTFDATGKAVYADDRWQGQESGSGNMNKKRKILTLVALAVFSVLIALHYVSDYEHSYIADMQYDYEKKEMVAGTGFFVEGVFRRDPKLKDVRLLVFVLAVFYAGLFAILGDNKRKEQ